MMKDINEVLSKIRSLLKAMNHHCDPSVFNSFRQLLHGPSRGSQVFPNGVYFEGVSADPLYFTGASGAHDALLPTIDAFTQLSISLKKNDL